MQRVFDFLRFDDIPLTTRPNYAAELAHITMWGVVAGAIDGYVAGIVAAKTFHASKAVTTLIWALPIMINLFNPLWGVLLRGRRRIPTFIILGTCGLLGVFSVAFLPQHHPHAALIFACQIGFIHIWNSGMITLRTTMWRANYPQSHRARIAGRLQTVRLLLTLATVALLNLLFDWQAWAYQIVYPAIALIGTAALFPLRRIRVRGERRELEQARAATSESGRRGLRAGLGEVFGILRTDRVFAQYMLAQFLLGSANFFTEPLLLNALTQRFDFRYLDSALIATLIPAVVMLIAIRFWAPFFDRVGVLRFRIYNSLMWTLSYVGISIAMIVVAVGGLELLPITVLILAVSRIFTGLGRSGGVIAWNIGHLHFARKEQTELYMGIHVGLTGLRALTMSFLGWACGELIGYYSFLVALALAVTAHGLFRRLASRQRLASPDSPAPASPQA